MYFFPFLLFNNDQHISAQFPVLELITIASSKSVPPSELQVLRPYNGGNYTPLAEAFGDNAREHVT